MKEVSFKYDLPGQVIYPPSGEEPHYPDGYGVDLGLLPLRVANRYETLGSALEEPLDRFGTARFQIPQGVAINIASFEGLFWWNPTRPGESSKTDLPHSDASMIVRVVPEPMPERTTAGMSAYRALGLYLDVLKEISGTRDFIYALGVESLMEMMTEVYEEGAKKTREEVVRAVFDLLNNVHPQADYEKKSTPDPLFTWEESKEIRLKTMEALNGAQYVEGASEEVGDCVAFHAADCHFRLMKEGKTTKTPVFVVYQ